MALFLTETDVRQLLPMPVLIDAMAGVAGIGTDANWMGSHFNQANWYAFGRLAWNPDLAAQDIADEWIRQTFSNDPVVVAPVTQNRLRPAASMTMIADLKRVRRALRVKGRLPMVGQLKERRIVRLV